MASTLGLKQALRKHIADVLSNSEPSRLRGELDPISAAGQGFSRIAPQVAGRFRQLGRIEKTASFLADAERDVVSLSRWPLRSVPALGDHPLLSERRTVTMVVAGISEHPPVPTTPAPPGWSPG